MSVLHRDEDDGSKCVSGRHVHVRSGLRSNLAALELLAVRRDGQYTKTNEPTCPSTDIKNRTLTLTISHTLSCNFFNMQLFQNHYSFIKYFPIIKTVKLLSLKSSQDTWNNNSSNIIILIIMIRRLKAKTRRLGLCIQVEKLQRQPHNPIEVTREGLEIFLCDWKTKLCREPAGWVIYYFLL